MKFYNGLDFIKVHSRAQCVTRSFAEVARITRQRYIHNTSTTTTNDVGQYSIQFSTIHHVTAGLSIQIHGDHTVRSSLQPLRQQTVTVA